jgi:hypothetical protein
MENDRLARAVAGIVADAEAQGFSYPLHRTIELADGRRTTDVLHADGSRTRTRTVTPMADLGGSRLLPATVEVREWDAATGKPKEQRALRTEIGLANYSSGE